MHLNGIFQLAALVGVLTVSAGGAEPHDSAWVTRRAAEWQPTAKDRGWESVGWAKSLSEALRLGKEHGRPILLFTHDGRLNVGRC